MATPTSARSQKLVQILGEFYNSPGAPCRVVRAVDRAKACWCRHAQIALNTNTWRGKEEREDPEGQGAGGFDFRGMFDASRKCSRKER